MRLRCLATFFVFLCASAVFAHPKKAASCKVFLSVMEQDAVTVNLRMVGLNKPQRSWYHKNKNKKLAGLCMTGTEANGQKPLTPSSEADGLVQVGTAPLYALRWGEHIEYNREGYRYYSASGVLYEWDSKTKAKDGSTGVLVPITPLHNKNRTRATSSSSSLFKVAAKLILKRERSRLAN